MPDRAAIGILQLAFINCSGIVTHFLLWNADSNAVYTLPHCNVYILFSCVYHCAICLQYSSWTWIRGLQVDTFSNQQLTLKILGFTNFYGFPWIYLGGMCVLVTSLFFYWRVKHDNFNPSSLSKTIWQNIRVWYNGFPVHEIKQIFDSPRGHECILSICVGQLLPALSSWTLFLWPHLRYLMPASAKIVQWTCWMQDICCFSLYSSYLRRLLNMLGFCLYCMLKLLSYSCLFGKLSGFPK